MRDRRCGESGPLARPTWCWPGAVESRPGAALASTSASYRRWLPADQSYWAGMKVGLGLTWIDSITLGDGEGQGERAPSRLIGRIHTGQRRSHRTSYRELMGGGVGSRLGGGRALVSRCSLCPAGFAGPGPRPQLSPTFPPSSTPSRGSTPAPAPAGWPSISSPRWPSSSESSSPSGRPWDARPPGPGAAWAVGPPNCRASRSRSPGPGTRLAMSPWPRSPRRSGSAAAPSTGRSNGRDAPGGDQLPARLPGGSSCAPGRIRDGFRDKGWLVP
jgi:hypothetical protein